MKCGIAGALSPVDKTAGSILPWRLYDRLTSVAMMISTVGYRCVSRNGSLPATGFRRQEVRRWYGEAS
jgi:hypothetical protein